MQSLIKRLEVVKSYIVLGDVDLIPVQLERLPSETAEVEAIVQALQEEAYSLAVRLIEALVSEQTQKGLIVFDQAELAGLKLELKALEMKLLVLSEEKQGIQLHINDFKAQHQQAVGDLLQALLDIRYRLHYQRNRLKIQEKRQRQEKLIKAKQEVENLRQNIKNLQQSELDDEQLDALQEAIIELKQEKEALVEAEALVEEIETELAEDTSYQAYKQVRQDRESYQAESDEITAQQEHALSTDDLTHLKQSYRKAAKLCHPDTFLFDEDKEDHANVMVELNLAYEAQNLQAVEDILYQLQHPSDKVNMIDSEEYLENIRKKVHEIQQRITSTQQDLERLKQDSTYQRIQVIEDWQAYFAQIRAKLETQLDLLQAQESGLSGSLQAELAELDQPMTERQSLLADVAELIGDYEGFKSLRTSVSQHIQQWLNQFDADIQQPLLQELYHILQKTYISKEMMGDFFRSVIEQIADQHDNGTDIWWDVHLLTIQQGGNSQRELVALFQEILLESYGISTSDDPNAPIVIYLDDIIFTGNRVKTDIKAWIEQKDWSQQAHRTQLYVVSMGEHSSGGYYLKRELQNTAKLGIFYVHDSAFSFENRKESIITSETDCLTPAFAPEHNRLYEDYVAKMTYKPIFRVPVQGNQSTSANDLYSSEASRSLLEQVFLAQGLEILQNSPYFKVYHRPLGYSKLETLGFGSLLVTYRNCPNNAPLALWAGDHPLFPRITNRQAKMMQSV